MYKLFKRKHNEKAITGFLSKGYTVLEINSDDTISKISTNGEGSYISIESFTEFIDKLNYETRKDIVVLYNSPNQNSEKYNQILDLIKSHHLNSSGFISVGLIN